MKQETKTGYDAFKSLVESNREAAQARQETTPSKEGLHTQGEEIQYLQNAADDLGLIIQEKYTQDKRQTIKKYFAQRGTETVSPVLDYEQLNHFLLGYRKAVNERKALLNALEACVKCLQMDSDMEEDFASEIKQAKKVLNNAKNI